MKLPKYITARKGSLHYQRQYPTKLRHLCHTKVFTRPLGLSANNATNNEITKAAIDADAGIKDGFRLWDDREDGSQEVAEAALIPVLVKAIQELSTKNDALVARITALEG
jgi:hypothetical protein